MPRTARLDAPGVLHHIMIRGIERRKIFRNNSDRIAERVAEVLEMEMDEIFSKGRQSRKVGARSLFCFWASRELGMSHTDLA